MAGVELTELWAHRRRVVEERFLEAAEIGTAPAELIAVAPETGRADISPGESGRPDKGRGAIRKVANRRPAWLDDEELLREEAARKVHLLHEDEEWLQHGYAMQRLGFAEAPE